MLAQHRRQLIANHFDNLLVRRKLQHHFAADGLLANLRQRGVQVLIGELALSAQILECALQLLCQVLKHGSKLLSLDCWLLKIHLMPPIRARSNRRAPRVKSRLVRHITSGARRRRIGLLWLSTLKRYHRRRWTSTSLFLRKKCWTSLKKPPWSRSPRVTRPPGTQVVQ